jgi:eukaryotic-like serine/threonine-protein kinase
MVDEAFQRVNQRLFPPGTVLGKYRLVRLIGEGGMGAVYEATHVDLGKRVAVKTLLPELVGHAEAGARFRREGQALARIAHTHVVNVVDFGTEEGTPYLVMEYLVGETLADKLRREERLEVDQTLSLLLPILDGLDEGHRKGVVHRDLKPQNIFLARVPAAGVVPKLLDFGISKMADPERLHQLTRTGAIMGSALYMAPEQVDGAKNADARSDQYSMGLILFECVAGRPARQGLSALGLLRNLDTGKVPSLREALPAIDTRLDAAVTRSLAPTPADRFPTMVDLMRALVPSADSSTRAIWAERLVARTTR